MRGRRQAHAAAAATTLAVGLVAQSCGVMSSSDCADKASCAGGGGEVSSGSSEGGSGGSGVSSSSGASGSGSSSGLGTTSGGNGGEGGDDAAIADVSTNDVPTEGAGDFDATSDGASSPDATTQDAAMVHDATASDAVSAHDAIVDGAGVVDRLAFGDGCAATEDCTNGVDDNCNGLVDCADPACSAYACTPPLPAGWDGLALLWTGAYGAAPPACPAGAQAIDANGGLTGGSADGCHCTCNASGETCSTTGTFMSQNACQASSACGTVQVSSDGACVAASSASGCGEQGSFAAPTPAPSGGSCMPQTTTMPGTAVGWTTSARVCPLPGVPDGPGGCAAGQQCVGPTTGYSAAPCVYSGADPPPSVCPAGYTAAAPMVFYGGVSDTRACGDCSCASAPSGGSCSGTITLYGSNAGGCTGTPPATFTLGMSTCLSYVGFANAPGYAQASFTLTPGTCSVPAPPQPTGAVTGTSPTTVCCK